MSGGAGYLALCRRAGAHPIRAAVPAGWATALPLPTRRAGAPGWACFAGPTRPGPGGAVAHGAPDRWWVLDVAGGELLCYARTSAVPLAALSSARAVLVPAPAGGPAERRAELGALARLLDELAPAFHAGATAAPSRRRILARGLGAVLPAPLAPWYRALAPDLFAWVEAS